MLRVGLVALLLIGVIAIAMRLARRNGPSSMSPKTFRALLILGVLVFFVLIPIFIYSRVATAWEVFDRVVQSFTDTFRTPIWLTRGIVVLLLYPFLWGLERTFAFTGRNRRAGLAVVIVYVGLYCFAMHGLSRGTYFDPNDATNTKWYCVSPEGFRVFDAPGFDPKYGLELKPVTPDIAPLLEQQRRGGPIGAANGAEYFDPTDGRPLKWYWRSGDGQIELFDRPGYHPRYQDLLKAVTPGVVHEIEEGEKRGERAERAREFQRKLAHEEEVAAAQEISFRARYISAAPSSGGGPGAVVLVIAESAPSGAAPTDRAFTQAVAGELQRVGYRVQAGVFRDAAYADGIVDRLARGDRELLSQLGLDRFSGHLLICRRESEYSDFRQLRDRITCKTSLLCDIVRASGGARGSEVVSGAGLGATREEAGVKSAAVVGTALGERLAALMKR